MRARTIYLIKRLEAASRLRLDAALKDLDLTPRQYTTLSILASHADTSASDLARRVLVTAQSMSEVIIVLDRKGLVRRKESQENRRVLGLSLSEAGRALLEQADARVDALEASLFGELNGGDLEHLRASVETVLKADRT